MEIFSYLFLPIVLALPSLGVSLFFFILFLLPGFRSGPDIERRLKWGCMSASVAWFLNAFLNWWISDLVGPIRIDLLVIAPVLLVLTIWGLIAGFRNTTSKSSSGIAGYSSGYVKRFAGFGALVFLCAFAGFSTKKPLLERLLVGDLSGGDALWDLKKLPATEQATYVTKLAAALKDKNWNKRLHAVYMLGYIGQPLAASSIPAMQEALKDENTDVSSAASSIMAQWGYKTDAKIKEDLDTVNMGALDNLDRYQPDKINADAPHLITVLLNYLLKNPSPYSSERHFLARLVARYTAACDADPAKASKIFKPSLPVLIKILDSADDTHHAAALNILGYIDTPEARSALKIYSERELERVRKNEELACGGNKIYNFTVLEEAQDKLVFSVNYVFDSILPGKRKDTNIYSDLRVGGMEFKGDAGYAFLPMNSSQGVVKLSISIGSRAEFAPCAKSDVVELNMGGIGGSCTRTFPYKKDWKALFQK